MKLSRLLFSIGAFFLLLLNVQCDDDLIYPEESLVRQTSATPVDLMKPDGEESAGNNLSFPVIWADVGTSKTLRGSEEQYTTQGEWWYVWGEDPIDPQAPLYSCEPDPNNPDVCLISQKAPGDGISTVYKAYLQKDAANLWQATNTPLYGVFDHEVDLIDWGDNLESVDWTLRSQVRTEVVLYENLATPVTQYAMRHVDGWGVSEVHGLQWDMAAGEPMLGTGDQATVYSHNARLTIQKLNVESLDDLGTLTWDTTDNKWTGTNVNEPLFNMAVYEAGDGPGYYNAEINVKGKVIYGYTWNVKKMNEGLGYYRITFSLDDDGPVLLETSINNADIILPLEVEAKAAAKLVAAEEEGTDTGGGTAVIDRTNNPGDGSGGGKDNNPGAGTGGGGNGPGRTR